MICSTCGRDNEAHLVFCRECGQRLALRATPPTPPEGVAKAAIGGGGVEELLVCLACGGTNQRSMRYCVACGHVLASIAPAAPDSSPLRAARTEPDELAKLGKLQGHGEGEQDGSVGLPRDVSEVAAPLAAPASPRQCPRCRAAADAGANYCRVCGAGLADPGASGPTLGSGRPSSSPSPLPANPVLAGTHQVTSVAAKPSTPPRSPVPRQRGTPNPPGAHTPMPPPPSLPNGPEVTYIQGAEHGPAGRLVLIGRDGGEGPTFPLRDKVDIGRLEGTVVVNDDRYLSPRHARIVVRNGTYVLRDLESTNGIFVRIPFLRDPSSPSDPRAPLDPEQELGGQELFLVGQQVLRFEVVKHAEEGLGIASEHGTLLFGTPAAPRFARISQRTVEGVIRDVFHVRKTETVIGRESGDIVFSDDPFVSRRHALVRVLPAPSAIGRRFTLADLGSSNGTFLKIREEVRLRHGDHFRVGQQLLRLDLEAASSGA